MVIDVMEVEGVAVCLLQGAMEAEAAPGVREMVGGLLATGRRYLVLDLSGVVHMYTAGLAVLLELQAQAAAHGGLMVCCGARPFVREILYMTMLDRTLVLKPDLESALDELRIAS